MNWNELVLVADDIVTEFGQPIVLKSITQGEYNPETSVIENIVVETKSIGVLFDYGEKDINGSTILKGDKKLLVKPTGISSISTNDTITVDGSDYHIVMVMQTKPAGVNLLYELSLRGVS